MNKTLNFFATTLLFGALTAASSASATVYSFDVELDLNEARISSYNGNRSINLDYDFDTPFSLATGDTILFNFDFAGNQRLDIAKTQYDQQAIHTWFLSPTARGSVDRFSTSFQFTDVAGDLDDAMKLIEFPGMAGSVNAGPYQQELTDSSFSFGGGQIAIDILGDITGAYTVETFQFQTGMSYATVITPVSEPQLMGLLGLGLVGFAGVMLRKKHRD